VVSYVYINYVTLYCHLDGEPDGMMGEMLPSYGALTE
jgi:hypothetical protein